MAHLKRRMIVPDLFARPDLQPSAKRLLFAGMLCLAEDSGCLEWNAGLLKALVLPLEEATTDDVSGWLAEYVRDGLAWPYMSEGRAYAYLPDFHRWQGRMARWNAPEAVPTPPGLSFTPFTAKERIGSGLYEWPASREALESKDLEPNDLEPNDVNQEKEGESLELKEAASSQPAASPLPADNDKAITILAQRLGKERTSGAKRKAKAYAGEHGVELDDKIRRFFLEEELENAPTPKR